MTDAELRAVHRWTWFVSFVFVGVLERRGLFMNGALVGVASLLVLAPLTFTVTRWMIGGER